VRDPLASERPARSREIRQSSAEAQRIDQDLETLCRARAREADQMKKNPTLFFFDLKNHFFLFLVKITTRDAQILCQIN